MALVSCAECSREISTLAPACPHCGAPNAQALASTAPAVTPPRPEHPSFHPGIAAVMSLLIPGAGQMYKGHVGAGILWLLGTVIGYVLMIVPGLILHIICIVNAASRKTSDVPAADDVFTREAVQPEMPSRMITCPHCHHAIRLRPGDRICYHCHKDVETPRA